MAYDNILFEVAPGIATITFNRPKALNALNAPLFTDLSGALDEVEADESIRVLVLTGAGEKAFAAGADITELAEMNPLQLKMLSRRGQRIFGRLQDLAIPVIAAVNGFALGAGCEVAMACDFIYASDNAKFGLPELNLGLIPGYGGTQRLPRLIGSGLSKELMFTGKMISAQEAKEAGMVNRVFAQEVLMEETLKTAQAIAQKGRVCLRGAKHAVNSGLDVDLENGCKIEADAFAICMASEDAKEGTRAFLEKRKPEFKGTFKG